MRRLHARLAAACVLTVATALFTGGSAFAHGGNGGHGGGNGYGHDGSQQSQPQQQPQQQGSSWSRQNDHHSTEGQPQQQPQAGVKPSHDTKHWTHTTVGAKPDVSKRYGNGKTAAQIAASRGAPASRPLTGPGNSQPHKTYDCGHKSNRSGGVDVHAIKSYSASGCASATQPQSQEQPVYVSYCQHEGNRWVYKTTTTRQLAQIVKTEDVIAPTFSYEGHSYSKHWDSEGQAIYSHCKRSGSFEVGGTTTTTPAPTEQGHKITICHATGSSTNPYVEITVDVHALKHGHTAAKGDIIPAPAGGCPAAAPTPPVVPTVSFCDMTSPTQGVLETKPATEVVSHELNGTPEEARDIVPPFTYNGQSYSQRWDSTGQAIFNNHCVAPAAVVLPTTTVTTTTPVTITTTTQAATTTTVAETTTTTPAGGVAGTTTTATTTTVPQVTQAPAAATTTASAGGVLGAQTSLAPKPASRGGVLGTVTHVAGSSLPFTGFPVWLAALIALALILAGFALRRRTLGARGL